MSLSSAAAPSLEFPLSTESVSLRLFAPLIKKHRCKAPCTLCFNYYCKLLIPAPLAWPTCLLLARARWSLRSATTLPVSVAVMRCVSVWFVYRPALLSQLWDSWVIVAAIIWSHWGLDCQLNTQIVAVNSVHLSIIYPACVYVYFEYILYPYLWIMFIHWGLYHMWACESWEVLALSAFINEGESRTLGHEWQLLSP